MQFVQKTVFSSNYVSKDVLSILGAFGDTQVKKAFEAVKDKPYIEGVFKTALNAKFIDVSKFASYNSPNRVPYISIEKALGQLHHFTIESPFYQSVEAKQKKFFVLLESLTFVEASMIYNIVAGEYDKVAVKAYLFPPKRSKKMDEQSPELGEEVITEEVAIVTP